MAQFGRRSTVLGITTRLGLPSFPGSTDNAYIGSNYPASALARQPYGSAAISRSVTSTLAMEAKREAAHLRLLQLTVSGGLAIGDGERNDHWQRRLVFRTKPLSLLGDSLVFASGDTVASSLNLYNNSQATTKAAGTLPEMWACTAAAHADSGVHDTQRPIDVRDSSTTLNMAGYTLSADTVLLGWYNWQPVNVSAAHHYEQPLCRRRQRGDPACSQ